MKRILLFSIFSACLSLFTFPIKNSSVFEQSTVDYVISSQFTDSISNTTENLIVHTNDSYISDLAWIGHDIMYNYKYPTESIPPSKVIIHFHKTSTSQPVAIATISYSNTEDQPFALINKSLDLHLIE